MKKIGFIDYFMSEWHANHYPELIKKAAADIGEDFTVAYAWAECEVSPFDNVTTDEWCKQYNVERCASIDELCEKSDYILILSPSNPEKHLEYAAKALKYGKNTYIDKTFAPDFKTAEEIFKIANENGAKIFSTSALRFATELESFKNAKRLEITGGGSNIEEYIIHQIEMLVCLFKSVPERVMVESTGENSFLCSLDFGDGEYSTMSFAEQLPFAVTGHQPCGTAIRAEMQSDFFAGLIGGMLNFYLTGNAPFDVSETLLVMKIRDAVIKGTESLGKWVEVC